MNKYYCGICKTFTFSAALIKNPKCPTCSNKTIINPNVKEVKHAQSLVSRMGFIKNKLNKGG